MNKIGFIIIFLFSLFYFTSCKNDEMFFQLETTYSEIITESDDTTAFSISFNDDLKNVNYLILETPYNLYFKASINNIQVAENLKGQIVRTDSNLIQDSYIPVLPYNASIRFKIDKELINSSNEIRFKVFDSEFVKDSTNINIYCSSNSSIGNKQQKEIDLESEIKFSSSNLPIIKINTNDIITDTSRIFADYIVFDSPEKENNLTANPNYIGKLKIKIRGSSSKLFPKQSYSITTYNNDYEKENVQLLGLPQENDWVLYAPYVDLSLMRNALAYRLHREMGHYSPRTNFCHLIINNDYRGIYVLTEKIKRDKERINISKLNSEDSLDERISGGYIVKLDKGKGKVWKSPYKSQIDTGWGKWFIYVYPKEKNLTDRQAEYIRNYITEFEHALVKNSNWKDYIDINSFIDFMILMEVTKNVDAYRLSTFFSKDREGELMAEPLWDLNLSFGLTSYYDGYKTEGLMYNDGASPFWWRHFLQFDDFKQQFVERWKYHRNNVLSDENIHKIVDEYSCFLKKESENDAIKWRLYEESSNWRKYDRKDYMESIEYLKSWISQRNAYLDKEFSELK